MSLPPGTRLGAYEVQALLGQGGMGDVYRAFDPRLNRTVAIKTLPAALAADADRLARFEREARLASSLSHPNIVVIYDIGHAENVHFIAMEYVEGETLGATIARGPALPAAAAEMARQIADGLARAHASGIIHRDLKPSNIMVTTDGRVKLLDFGLSKLVESAAETAATHFGGAATTPGVLIGTAAYMSPEQALGRPTDPRSDQFSFGVILYELLTRRHPFQRGSAVQTMSAIIEAEPEPLAALNPKVPEALAHVIDRCLAKDPRQRFASTSDLALAVENIRDHLRSGRTLASVARIRPRKTRHYVAAAVIALAIAVGGWFGWQRLEKPASSLPASRQIAVLPLAPIGDAADHRLLSDGLAEVLTTRLTELERFAGSLRVVPASEVRREQINSARDAHRAFGVNLVVSGSIQRVADGIRLTLNVVDPVSVRILRAETLDAPLTDVTALQDEVVVRVARLLEIDVGREARSLLAAGVTRAPGAYEYYLQGRAYLQRYERPENLDAALSLFTRATEQDPNFALARAALAEASWRKYEATRDAAWVERAKTAAATAVTLGPQLAQPRVTLAMIAIGTGRYEEAGATLGAVLAEDPTNADAYRELAHAYEALGDFTQAERTFQSAIRARPGDWLAYNQLGAFYSRRGKLADAALQFERVVALTPDNARGHSNLGGIYVMQRRFDEGIAALEKAVQLNPMSAAVTNLGTTYFRQGRYKDAAGAFEKATRTRGQDYRVWRNLASAYEHSGASPENIRQAFTRAAELAEAQRQVNPRNATLLASLADCYAHIGQADKARDLVNEAARLAPKDGQIFLLSAQVFEQLGDRKQALARVALARSHGVSREEIEGTRTLDALRRDPGYDAPKQP